MGAQQLLRNEVLGTEGKEVAFYYPGHLWYDPDWVKNLLLFFDGIALLVPRYKQSELEHLDPSLVGPLRHEGLLTILEAEVVVDKSATEKLSAAMVDIITSGLLDPLANQENTRFHELSYSRLGGYGDPGLAKMILEELKSRNLARDTEDGVSIPMHPHVRALILVLLAQILRPYGAVLGAELSPATDRKPLVDALCEMLSVKSAPSSGRVVSFDLETVGADLRYVPLDEVLSYRKEHYKEHRAYARAVRRFVYELSAMPENERAHALEARQAELQDMANRLKRESRRAWKKPAAFAIALAGAAWKLASDDPIGALLVGAAAALGGGSRQTQDVGVYSYIFNAPGVHV